MGGGIIILAKKGLSLLLFVRRLSVFGCSQFPPEQKKKEKGARQKKMEGTNGPDPLVKEIPRLSVITPPPGEHLELFCGNQKTQVFASFATNGNTAHVKIAPISR